MADAKRLIDADELMDQMTANFQQAFQFGCDTSAFSIVEETIEDAPTVDAVEVVHGRWEWLGPYRYNDEGMIGTCSVCKERLRIFAHNYCPNCGAKMGSDATAASGG